MFDEDLSLFFDTNEFAVVVTHIRQTGPQRTFQAIFDDPYLNADLGEYDMDTTDPRLTAAWASIASVARGDRVIVQGQHYDVLTGAQRDGTGTGVVKLAPHIE